MPDRYSEAEVEAMRGTRPHPLAHVIDPRIVQFNEERRRWIATLDAIKAERDAALAVTAKHVDEVAAKIEAATSLDYVAKIKADRDRAVEALRELVEHESDCEDPGDCETALRLRGECREYLARVGKGGA